MNSWGAFREWKKRKTMNVTCYECGKREEINIESYVFPYRCRECKRRLAGVSSEIKQCQECGCIFIGDNPYDDWFECGLCGATYKKRQETGLWYLYDDYVDKFDFVDMVKADIERDLQINRTYYWWIQYKWLRGWW